MCTWTNPVHALAFARPGDPLLHHAIRVGARPGVRGGRRALRSSRLTPGAGRRGPAHPGGGPARKSR
eukprot:322978-Alexandrium_andersonii.AAC.1